MNSERRKLIDKVFSRALELTGEERSAYIKAHCDDEDLRKEVLKLLDAAQSAQLDEHFDSVRERIWSDVVAQDAPPEDDLTGQRAGVWRIDRRLARGGLATVYLAHREDGEFEQTVAFKVLRRGLDTDDLIARFRTERQILSTLDHPAIAQILDGGALPDGRPYLVLEYVDGLPITAYCETASSGVRDRVKLVIDMLNALHHAHKHLVVHRDIKPSNVLVSSAGNVALLDFGIAKLLDPQALPGVSTLTRTGVSLLTPGYGSPEQRAGQAVTTASDIYQVGGVLYELLTGKRPSSLGEDAEAGAPSRQLKGTEGYRQVRGDLDAIVLKAMHADPARRYASANEMLADLQRYLDGRPVTAQPDTLGYRLRKLTKRHRWILPVAALFIAGIVAYIVTLTLYSRQLQLEQQRAEAARTFMVDLFSSSDPFAPADPERGRNITVVEALEIGRQRLENEVTDQPELKATLLASIAGVYSSLDQNEQAIELGEQALALHLDLYGEASEPVLENLRLLAAGYDDIGDYAHARLYFDRQLAISRVMFASEDPRLGAAEVASGVFEIGQGNHDAALKLLMSAIGKLRAAPADYARTFITAVVAAIDEDGMYDAQAFVPLLEEARAVAEGVFGLDSLYTANVLLAIARNSFYLKDLERAKTNYAIGLEIFDTQLGPQHSDTIGHMNNYGFLLMGIGDDAGAEAIHWELLQRLIESRGENHRLVADNYQNLASAIHRQGRFDEALPLHRKARDIYSEVLDQEHYLTAFPLLSIAYVELRRGNPEPAEAAATEALDAFRAAVPGSYMEGVAMCLVGLAKEKSGDFNEGAAMVQSSHALIPAQQQNLVRSPYPKLCRVPPVDRE